MSPDELQKLTDHFLEAWNQCDTGKLDEILAPDFLYHSYTYGDLDREAYRKYVVAVHTAYPSAHITLEQMLRAEDDHIIWRMTFHGTDKGGSVILGTAPTGKQVTMRMIAIARLRDNLLAEESIAEDALGLAKQLKG